MPVSHKNGTFSKIQTCTLYTFGEFQVFESKTKFVYIFNFFFLFNAFLWNTKQYSEEISHHQTEE